MYTNLSYWIRIVNRKLRINKKTKINRKIRQILCLIYYKIQKTTKIKERRKTNETKVSFCVRKQ